jgi:hypothetical protein
MDRFCAVVMETVDPPSDVKHKSAKSSSSAVASGSQAANGSSDTKASSTVTSKASALHIDPFAVEQLDEFQRRKGKWVRHTLTVCQDRLFHRVTEVMHITRVGVMQLSWFLKKKIPETEIEEKGGHLAQLVNFKAEAIYSEIVAPLCVLCLT